jgi:hypothetical protein
MKTSYFYSPKHPSKICDIAIEVIIDTYHKKNIDIHSDIFSFINEDTLYLNGNIKTNHEINFSELLSNIENEIGTNYKIINNIKTIEVNEILEERTFSGIYLGYSCLEDSLMIPFEHQMTIELTRKIYDKLDLPLKTQIHINGNRPIISLEHGHDNFQEINAIVNDFFTYDKSSDELQFLQPEIYHNIIKKDIIYKSNDTIISTFYGPRAWYGEVDYIGSDFLSNKRLGHFICREIATDWGKKNTLSYCAIELDFTSDIHLPIHFGKKGNKTGIHLENGTFFQFGDIENEYPLYKKIVLDKIKSGEIDIIEIAKWGFPNINI